MLWVLPRVAVDLGSRREHKPGLPRRGELQRMQRTQRPDHQGLHRQTQVIPWRGWRRQMQYAFHPAWHVIGNGHVMTDQFELSTAVQHGQVVRTSGDQVVDSHYSCAQLNQAFTHMRPDETRRTRHDDPPLPKRFDHRHLPASTNASPWHPSKQSPRPPLPSPTWRPSHDPTRLPSTAVTAARLTANSSCLFTESERALMAASQRRILASASQEMSPFARLLVSGSAQ